jgi:pimeloyl-ACP methyl ester carboxylesterase
MRSLFAPVLLCNLLVSGPCLGEIVRDYGYPIADPLEATVLGTPPEYQAELPEEIPIQTREVRVLPGRGVPEIFWYTANLRYSVSAQPGPAPLVFIIPGTGANFDAGKSLILQRALYQAGLHVVSLPSPLHPNFIVSASRSRRPGILTQDADDIYRVLELIRNHLQDEIAITGYNLVGYSLGGTNAAFVARLDEMRRSFEFDRVLLINPPVSLEESAKVLDRLVDEHIPTIAAFNALFNRLMRLLSEFYSPAEPVLLSDELVYEIYRRQPLSDSTLEALIGAAFRLTSMNLIFTSDVMADVGVLVAPDRRLAITDSLTPYFKAAMELSFEDYARRVIYPYYVEVAPGTTFEQLVERESLRAIASFLRNTPKIGLMHNADDILVSADDLRFLEATFGERAQIYPRGGHNGNLAYRDNITYVVQFFSSRDGN